MLKTLTTDTIKNENTNEIIIKKKINRSKNIKYIDEEIDLMTNGTENINLNKEEKELNDKNTKNKLINNLIVNDNKTIRRDKLIDKLTNYFALKYDEMVYEWINNNKKGITGGEMRQNRGDAVENYVKNIINTIGKKTNKKLIALKGSESKIKISLMIDNIEIKKEHQVDIHIFLDDKIISVIECKSYLDSCYYTRALYDLNIFKKFGYNLKKYVFTLEESINKDTLIFLDYIHDYICDGLFIMIDEKRKFNSPLYKQHKIINKNNLKHFIKNIFELLD
jgi:hypothetical protein